MMVALAKMCTVGRRMMRQLATRLAAVGLRRLLALRASSLRCG